MNWMERLLSKSGLKAGTSEAEEALRGASKHGRAKTKAKGWKEAKRKARKAAKESRRRNR